MQHVIAAIVAAILAILVAIQMEDGTVTNAEKWSALWNHDVQFGFCCGCFAGVAGLILIMFSLDVSARLVVGGRPQKPVRRVRGDNGGRGL